MPESLPLLPEMAQSGGDGGSAMLSAWVRGDGDRCSPDGLETRAR